MESAPVKDDIIYATAVLAPPTDAGNQAQDEKSRPGIGMPQKSSYRLPSSTGSHVNVVNQLQVNQLKDQGYTEGLAQALTGTKITFPLRIWVVDNSGSMQTMDGHRFVETQSSNDVKIVPCTRWSELKECVTYHVQMAALLEAPSSFRLLNHPGALVGEQQFDVADKGQDMIPNDVQTAIDILAKTTPGGVTPLTKHIVEIKEAIELMKEELEQRGQKVSIVLATDGMPTDARGYGGRAQNEDFIQALRSLQGLPVWIVVRLCTDEDDVVDFYSNLDGQLEVSVEVLDDLISEAKEVNQHNKWLNYGLPLHRMREMGFHDRVFDMIDERRLSLEELRQFCMFLFGINKMDGMPDPAADWMGFLNRVRKLSEAEGYQWNPLEKRPTPWIDVDKLEHAYGPRQECCIIS